MYMYIYPWQRCENISCKQASQDITGAKKHIYSRGLLNPVISFPNKEGVKDNNSGAFLHTVHEKFLSLRST